MCILSGSTGALFLLSVSATYILIPVRRKTISYPGRRTGTSASPLIIACDRYFKLNLIQPTSLYVSDGARHLSLWLQLVLRERRFRTKFRALVTVIYFELYEGGKQFPKLLHQIHNYGHKMVTAVLTVQSCRDSSPVPSLLLIQGTDLLFPKEKVFVPPAYNLFYTHIE